MEAGFAFGGERNIAKTIRAIPFGEVMPWRNDTTLEKSNKPDKKRQRAV
jgi:hypothetical protein